MIKFLVNYASASTFHYQYLYYENFVLFFLFFLDHIISVMKMPR